MSARTQLWYSIADLASIFGFARSTVRLWWSEGRFGPVGDCIKVGDDLRIPQTGVDFFVQQNRVVRTPEQLQAQRLEIARRLSAREQQVHRSDPQPIPARNGRELVARARVFSRAENGGADE